MKRWTIIPAVTFVAVWLLVETVRDFAEAVRYFSSQPRQLLYVGGIALLGGLAVLGFDRLSARARRRFTVFAWGAAASTVTAFTGWLAHGLASLSPFVVESGDGHWVLLAVLSFAGIATCLWFEFYRALKREVVPGGNRVCDERGSR